MHKLNSLAAGIAILLVGCQPAHNSRTWETVKAAPHIGPGVPNRSSVYAQKLHQTLQHAGVEHRVVTFRFKYPTIQKIDRIGEDVAVIYKDAGTPGNPWWLMSECLWNPVWLPSGVVQRQVDFYIRRPAKIVSVAEFRAESGRPEGKSVVQRMEKADRRTRHSAKSGKRESTPAPKRPQGPPVEQVNPPTVRTRYEVRLRPA